MLVKAKGNEAISDDDFRRMQSMIPVCMPYEMSHPDHNVHLSNKDEFYEYFDAFLKRL
jgi:2-succinyl-6-hydroxy-2,4-cyclohexadiene-1-carboxylate synthase